MRYRIHYIDVQNALQNYIWILEDTETHEAVAVDPTEAELVTHFCQEHQLTLKQIWLTHWHKDHIGGVADLTANTSMAVYGPRDELSKIPGITHPLQHDDHLKFNDLNVEIIATPGHTLGHIVYFIEELNALFCGDTLFAMGCGRLFEGTAEQMYHSLNRLAALPTATKVYCTHEYTLSNAEFALGTVAKLAMRQPFVLFKGLTFQKLCLPGAFRPGDHHNKMLRPGLCVVHASPQYL